MRKSGALASSLVLALVAVGLTADSVSAQYFGRNKVQYKDFDFSVIETEHFDVYHYPANHAAAMQAGRMAERWYARLSRVLNHELRGKQPLILYASHPDFEQTNATPGQIGESTQGFTEVLKRRVVLPLLGSLEESDHVIGHELVHAFQFDITGRSPEQVGPVMPAVSGMPLWFVEGMAEYLSVGGTDPFTAQWLRGALKEDALPSLGDLGKRRYFPYRFGHAFWAYVGGRWGDQTVGQMLKAAARSQSIGAAIRRTLGVHPDTLIADWHESIREAYGPVLEATQGPDTYGSQLVSSETGGGDLNMGPAVSPDGDQMVFVSEKNLFSVELFRADANTGEIQKKLTQAALDPHFQSLQYLASAGAWSPEGERFALAAVSKGQPILSILDPQSGEKLREVRVPEAGEIFNPTWSPDGRRVAFSAQVGGFLDLFVVDLETREVTRLTNDPFAELHPSWAPDGSGIAFATDRFGSDWSLLTPGQIRLALIDPETREISALPGFDTGRHINPQWGPEGRSLYFVSNRTGTANIYRLERSSGQLYQVTDLQTGVSGITGLSPAMSVARESGKIVYSVHGEGNFVFDLYSITSEERLAGRPASETGDEVAALDPGVLPPRDRSGSRVDQLLADARLGLADTVTFESRDYEAGLSLDYIGQPRLAAGADQFGFFLGGGGSLFFSDMLGNRNLATMVQVESSSGQVFNNTALFADYTNTADRWNWGILGGQIPFVSQSFLAVPASTSAGPAIAFDELRFWQINREVTGRTEYPFNEFQRLELSAGGRSVDYAAQLRETLVSPVTGRVLSETETDCGDLNPDDSGLNPIARQCALLGNLSTVNMGRVSAALVWDNSVFGATAPMQGQRYRFEVNPTVGDLNYYNVLADYRKYFMPVMPFTLAFRGLHFGRYGEDAEDFRLSDLFIGRASLVRGYDAGSFNAEECPVVTTSGGGVDTRTDFGTGCPVFDQLLGSRVGVFNAEARLPFLGGVGLIRAANVPPIDLLAFFDAGIAWTSDIDPTFLDGQRQFVRSVGVGARMNVFGLLVLELDFVNPLDRPRQDWMWDLSVVPGF